METKSVVFNIGMHCAQSSALLKLWIEFLSWIYSCILDYCYSSVFVILNSATLKPSAGISRK